jgi:L-amino acid N-acyltransferase YncA
MKFHMRPALAVDTAAITAIYAHHVMTGAGTFEEIPPDEAEMAARLAAVQGRGLPWLAAVDANSANILGYAYAGPFRLRSAYRFTVEDSVYIAAEAQGRGVGRALLEAVVAACAELGCRRMFAAIGDSANVASIRLHQACGFEDVGVFRNAGLKFGQWRDVVFMARDLGDAGDAVPDAALDPIGLLER